MASQCDPKGAADECTIVELRRYTLHPGARERLISLFEREFAQFRRSRAPIPDDPEQSHVRSSRAAHEGTIGCVSVSVNFLGVSQDRDHPSP